MPRSTPPPDSAGPTASRRPVVPVRASLAVYYASHFGHLGIVLPFLPPWLFSMGLAPSTIGVLLALGPLAKLATPWTWGALADRSGRRRDLLAGSTAAAAVAFFVLGSRLDLVGLALTMGLYALCFAPGIPFVEATALEQAEARGFAYGRVRLWGSLAFAALSAGYGALSDRLSGAALFPLGAAVLLVGAIAGGFLPAPRGLARHLRNGAGPVPPLTDRVGLIRLLFACTLMQVSHGAYYTFYSIRLADLGYSGTSIGALWALAVICEVVLLTRVDAIVDRVGTGAVLRVSLVAAAVRWLVISFVTDPVSLALAQALHALTYAGFHVAALREVYLRFGPARRATGQAMYSGVSYGLGFFIGTLASGFLAAPIGLPALYRGSAAVALTALLVLGPGTLSFFRRQGR